MNDKIDIDLGNVQKTLLLPLWGRAVETQKSNPKLTDNKAVEIISNIDYDFSTIAKNISWISQYAWVARCIHIDNVIKEFLKLHPEGSIVNIGCGLDTTFERIDNDHVHFYDLDLPDVINLRKNFFSNTDRRKMIPCSFLDDTWYREIPKENGVLFFAAGVFYYFEEEQIKEFFNSLAAAFINCELFFDSASPFGVKVANQKVIKEGGMDETAILKWGIKEPRQMESWHKNIKLINCYPMFRKMKKGLSFKMKYGLWLSDTLKIMSMVHLKIGE